MQRKARHIRSGINDTGELSRPRGCPSRVEKNGPTNELVADASDEGGRCIFLSISEALSAWMDTPAPRNLHYSG